MVLLPKPFTPKEKSEPLTRNVFFENDTMDNMAKHFVGNNSRQVSIIPQKHIFIKKIFHHNLTACHTLVSDFVKI